MFDLTRTVETGMPVHPGDPEVAIEPRATVAADGYRVSAVSMGTHAGTHVDAPSHTEPGGATVDDLPVESFEFDARLADLDIGAREPIRFEALPDPCGADLLVLDTGWARHWGTPRYADHPFLSGEAAARCADRGLSVALDAPSVDPSPSPDAREDEPEGLPAHRALLGAGLPIVENLTSLDRLPDRFELRTYPLALAGADGSPVRAVAVA